MLIPSRAAVAAKCLLRSSSGSILATLGSPYRESLVVDRSLGTVYAYHKMNSRSKVNSIAFNPPAPMLHEKRSDPIQRTAAARRFRRSPAESAVQTHDGVEACKSLTRKRSEVQILVH